MGDFFSNLSSYNIFNYLFPGAILYGYLQFRGLAPNTEFSIIVSFFLLYFAGLVISRVGSLFLKRIIERMANIKEGNYKRYVAAAKKDSLVATFSEIANMYRSLVATMFLIPFLSIYGVWSGKVSGLEFITDTIFSTALMGLFITSYGKQDRYLAKRIDIACATPPDQSDKATH